LKTHKSYNHWIKITFIFHIISSDWDMLMRKILITFMFLTFGGGCSAGGANF